MTAMNSETIINETKNGKVFSAIFIKKDGSERKMVARTGVSKGVTGAGRKFDPADQNLLSVYDMQKRAFRFININTLKELKANHKVFTND
jgi:hypothetical protein